MGRRHELALKERPMWRQWLGQPLREAEGREDEDLEIFDPASMATGCSRFGGGVGTDRDRWRSRD
jgi:hypothetical protein